MSTRSSTTKKKRQLLSGIQKLLWSVGGMVIGAALVLLTTTVQFPQTPLIPPIAPVTPSVHARIATHDNRIMVAYWRDEMGMTRELRHVDDQLVAEQPNYNFPYNVDQQVSLSQSFALLYDRKDAQVEYNVIGTWNGGTAPYTLGALSGDGTTTALWNDATAQLTVLRNFKESVMTYNTGTSPIHEIAVNHDGTAVAVRTDTQLRLYLPTHSYLPLDQLSIAHSVQPINDTVLQIALLNDSELVALTRQGIVIYPQSSTPRLLALPSALNVNDILQGSLQVSNNGDFIGVIVGNDVVVWSIGTDAAPQLYRDLSDEAPIALGFLDTGHVVAAYGLNAVRAWSMSSNARLGWDS